MSALDEYRKNNGLLKDCETKVEKDEYLFGLGCFVNGWDARDAELAQLRARIAELEAEIEEYKALEAIIAIEEPLDDYFRGQPEVKR